MKCLELVVEVGEVKSCFGLFIYVLECEVFMLVLCCVEVEVLGVLLDLIEDVLCWVMCEFYFSENDKGFKIFCLLLCLVVIVGGGG